MKVCTAYKEKFPRVNVFDLDQMPSQGRVFSIAAGARRSARAGLDEIRVQKTLSGRLRRARSDAPYLKRRALTEK